MDANLFLDALHIFSCDICNIDNLARIDGLSDVWCRSVACLFALLDDLVSNLLGFNNLSILALAKLIVHIDEETVDLAHSKLLGFLSIGLDPSSCLRRLLFVLLLLLSLHNKYI